jgi:hypothetical protein
MSTVNELCKREHRQLFLALHADAKTYPGGITALADEFGCNRNTLASQLNPDSEQKPPAFSSVLEILIRTGGRRSIYALCRLVDKVPMDMVVQHRSPQEAIGLFLKLVAAASRALEQGSNAASDGHFSSMERKGLELLLLELMRATGELLNATRG